MLTRHGLLSPASRSLMAAMVAVLLLTIPEPPMAAADPLLPASDAASATIGLSDATDFSAARRRRYYGRGNAAGLAFFGMALGTIGAIAAQQQRNDYYNNYGYGYGYGYGPGYYGGDPYYGRRYYRRY
jgi:hypothetical protein